MTQDALGLAETLQEFRERKGLSRRALSQQAGLSASYVGKLETGEIEPSLRAFLSISRALALTQNEVAICIRIAMREFLS
jgi:transcriptional regulator with XRE-family HTH domain